MTLDQRRCRLRLGVVICAISIAALIVAAVTGWERHITLVSSMPLWPALGVLAGQWASVNSKIAVYGPDQLEVLKLRSRMALAVAISALVALLAIGGILSMRVAV